jgi:hypothetical protein
MQGAINGAVHSRARLILRKIWTYSAFSLSVRTGPGAWGGGERGALMCFRRLWSQKAQT